MKLFDTHIHLADEQFDADIESVIADCRNAGVAYMLECATELADFEKVMNIAHTYAEIYAAIGVHPHCAGSFDSHSFEEIIRLTADKKVKAIGEIGLDYHYDFFPRELQIKVLEKQLETAIELNLPVCLHNRESTGDMLAVLKNARGIKGAMHCFSGSPETAETLLDMGLYLGFGGSLTFKNNKKGVETAKIVPLDRFLLETDCPYLSPVPLRGTRNLPLNTKYVAEKFGEIRGMEADEVAARAFENGVKLYNITEI